MLRIFFDFRELDFEKLSAVYGYDETDRYSQRNDFYDYLREDFFRVTGAFYAVWELEGRYVSALRVEPYRDGYLIEALETRPEVRGKGYAKNLLNGVLQCDAIPSEGNVYAHIHKNNRASLAVHKACGFERILEHAVFIDGSVFHNSCTVKWKK